jgi:hypothetical protein
MDCLLLLQEAEKLLLYSRETHRRRRALILLLPFSRNTASLSSLSRVRLWAYFIQRNTNRALSLIRLLAVCSSFFGIAGKQKGIQWFICLLP